MAKNRKTTKAKRTSPNGAAQLAFADGREAISGAAVEGSAVPSSLVDRAA